MFQCVAYRTFEGAVWDVLIDNPRNCGVISIESRACADDLDQYIPYRAFMFTTRVLVGGASQDKGIANVAHTHKSLLCKFAKSASFIASDD